MISSVKFSKERLAQFRHLSERSDIYDLLSNAIGKANDAFSLLSTNMFIDEFLYDHRFPSAEHIRTRRYQERYSIAIVRWNKEKLHQ
jgi:hypothetical protein